MNNAMIDIETMAVSNVGSLVLSVACVPFEMTEERPDLGEERVWVLSVREQLAAGRIVDPSTQRFWMRQSEDAQRHWLAPSKGTLWKPEEFAQDFCSRVKGLASEARDFSVWANGIIFDLVNVETMLTQFGGHDLPWKYNAPRDYRTIVRCVPKIRSWYGGVIDVGASHDPVDDCRTQIYRLWEHWIFEDNGLAGAGTTREVR